MDLPNLLNKLKSTSEETKEFLAIEIGFDAVKTAIWQSTGTHTEVVSIGSVQTWSSANVDDLVTAIDTSLADAQGNSDSEPNQVIFGLPETWVDGDGIAESKKPILKTICQKLDLKAIGFVVTTEAILHHLRDVEGGPPSAILVQVATAEIATSLIYLGNLESTQVIDRSTTIAADVEEGLARMPHTGHLPSRMIVLSNLDDPEPVKQELISYDWQKKLEFLHFPKVESLPKEWSIKAIAVAGGAEVIATVGFANVPDSSKPVTSPPLYQTVTIEPESEPETTSEAPTSIQEEVAPEETKATATDFGFKPVNLNQEPPLVTSPLDDNVEVIEPEELTVPNPHPQSQSKPVVDRLAQPKKLLLGFGHRLKSLVQKPAVSKPSVQISPKRWTVPVIIGSAVVLILAVAGFAYYRFPAAAVSIYVSLSPYQQQLTFTVDPSATEANVAGLVVSGKKLTIDKSGSKTMATTGTKLVGDRAKGKVLIYNRTTASKNMPAGTVIKSGTLKFTLDTAVTIASASSKENTDYSITTEPSKAEVAATAADIGDQYNLAKDSEFAVSNLSNDNFFAVASAAFAGGSSRKVAAVAKEDMDNLKTVLIQDLRAQIDQNTSNETDSSIRQISVDEPKITTEKYSAEKGAEAAELTLDLAMTQTIYQYNVSEVSLLAQQVAQNSLPANVNMQPNSTQVNIVSSSISDDDKAVVNAQIILQYIPRIEVGPYKNALVNTPLNQIEKKVNQIPNYQRFNLDKKFLIFGRLPLNPQQISVRVVPMAKE